MGERETQMYLNFEQPRVIERFFARMEKDVLESLTPQQRQGVARAITRSFLYPSRKIIDLRWILALLRHRYDVTFFFGRDLRSEEPRYFSRHLSRTRWLANSVFLLCLMGFFLCGIIGLLWTLQKIFGFSLL
jgi:hypothetical protein